MRNRIKRLTKKNRPKIQISISVDKQNFEKAKSFVSDRKFSMSSMFDMFLEDFVFEELSQKEQDDIIKIDLKNAEKELEIKKEEEYKLEKPKKKSRRLKT